MNANYPYLDHHAPKKNSSYSAVVKNTHMTALCDYTEPAVVSLKKPFWRISTLISAVQDVEDYTSLRSPKMCMPHSGLNNP